MIPKHPIPAEVLEAAAKQCLEFYENGGSNFRFDQLSECYDDLARVLQDLWQSTMRDIEFKFRGEVWELVEQKLVLTLNENDVGFGGLIKIERHHGMLGIDTFYVRCKDNRRYFALKRV